MDKVLKKLFPYTLVFVGAFFLAPAIAYCMNLDEDAYTRVMLFLVMSFHPGVTFFSGLLFALRNGFRWFFFLDVGIIALLAYLFFLGPQLLFFVVAPLVGALVGCLVGSILKKHFDEMYL